jgi:hypothetical protein
MNTARSLATARGVGAEIVLDQRQRHVDAVPTPAEVITWPS